MMKTRSHYQKRQTLLTILAALAALGICNTAKAAAPEWSIIQITDNSYDDKYLQISGMNVVWEAHEEPLNPEIFLYNASTRTTTQITDNTYDDSNAQISGTNVVWEGYEARDHEIFFYDASTGAITQLTDNSHDDRNPQISGTNVVWSRYDGNDAEIFLHDASTQTTIQVTNNSYSDYSPQISGTNIVWRGKEGGNDNEVFFYDASTGTTTQITDNGYEDYDPQISGTNVVWRGYDGNDYEIFLYNASTGWSTRVTDNSHDDRGPQISGTNVVWQGAAIEYRDEIFLYDTSTETTTQLTNNDYKDSHPRISGTSVVWYAWEDGNCAEIFLHDASTGVTTKITHNDYPDWYPEVSGRNIAWRAFNGDDWEIFMAVPKTYHYYVNGTTGDDTYDGLAPEWDGAHGPKKTIQAGIDASSDGDTVTVADGTYTGDGNRDLSFVGREIILKSENGAQNTIIDCEGTPSKNHRGFKFHTGENLKARVDGFTICNGYASPGGGINCSSGVTIANCVITGNTSPSRGGGIVCFKSDSAILNCLIIDNIASGSGGGIQCDWSNSTITGCTIADNVAIGLEGYYGGGIYCYASDPVITNCMLWGDNPDEVDFRWNSELTLDYCDVQGGWTGAGSNNMDEDPMFVSGPLHNCYLSHLATGQPADSPCIDAGSDTAENLGLNELSTRTDGMPDMGIVDMGYHAPYALWIYSITRGSDDITIRWNALPGVSYTVQYSTDLENWTSIPAGETDTWIDASASGYRKKFYRVLEQ